MHQVVILTSFPRSSREPVIAATKTFQTFATTFGSEHQDRTSKLAKLQRETTTQQGRKYISLQIQRSQSIMAKAKRKSEKEWEEQKETIQRVYETQQQPLRVLMDGMTIIHGFEAT